LPGGGKLMVVGVAWICIDIDIK